MSVSRRMDSIERHVTCMVALAIAGCTSGADSRHDRTLCEVAKDSDAHIGTTVRLQLEYVADGTNFAFVRTPGTDCGLVTGNISGDSGDETYDDFIRRRADRCETTVCLAPAILDATIEIKPDGDGVVSAFIRRVHSVTFVGPDE